MASLGLAIAVARQPAPGDALTALARTAGIAATGLVILGPLLWGHAIGQFTISHHLGRALLLAPALVLYCWHVSAHR
ncbi:MULTISPECIES: hypothetical protein [unclassified Brachybacterium]|uniref:hypothetical protein n=1 Tax=unclassified Brachybacterium TaxID=2623841 RepID=UPI000C7FF58E|nr:MULTISPECIES: hypothetical protein [unclassified Brachybacterium]PMC76174.1 hypothetical protein CJ197_03085 [Brachybacterium sp. UMB0905]